jgi:hypothetical protein
MYIDADVADLCRGPTVAGADRYTLPRHRRRARLALTAFGTSHGLTRLKEKLTRQACQSSVSVICMESHTI